MELIHKTLSLTKWETVLNLKTVSHDYDKQRLVSSYGHKIVFSSARGSRVLMVMNTMFCTSSIVLILVNLPRIKAKTGFVQKGL